jgi:peptidoglycan hydrolase CwlO-like protein
MKYRGFNFFIAILILTATVAGQVGVNLTQAQTTADVEAKRAQLQAELEAEEKAIAAQTALLQAKQKETATVTGEISLLKSQIAQAQANIKAKKVAIARLADGIVASQGKITILDSKVKKGQSSLAELLRKTNDVDTASFVEILLDSNDLSDFFHNVDDFEAVQKAIQQSVDELRDTKVLTEKEKQTLEEKKNNELDAQKTIEYQQALIAQKEKERQQVLTITKGQEKIYQTVLKARQQNAAKIRAALFALRDTAAIPFGKALEYATTASQKTGVRPAFLLAILKQESNLGENVGSCLLSSLETGDGIGKNTGTFFEKVLKPPRDTVPFEAITKRLGLDWKMTPVSCPISSPKYYVGRGFGGGMGPAQFIPSTWELVKNRLGNLVGLSGDNVNPWDPAHAFMASALYLSDLGAGSGTYSGEIAAACKYYGSGGKSCVYGTQVMAKAQDIQLNMIDPLQNI